MKLTNNYAMVYSTNLSKLAECEDKFSIKFLHARAKNERALKPIVEDFNKLKDDLVREYGEPNEEGNISVSMNNAEFMTKFNELLSCENEVEIVRVSIDDLPAELSAKTYDMISWMVEE